MKEIMQIALADPTLGPGALSAIFNMEIQNQRDSRARGAGSGISAPAKVQEAIWAGLKPGTPEFKSFVGGDAGDKKTEVQRNAEALYPNNPAAQQDYIRQVTTESKSKEPTDTPAMKNAVALGLKPGTPEYNDYIKQETLKPLVTVGGPAPVNKALEGRFTAAISGGDAARAKLSRLSSVETALQGMPTGAGAGMIAGVGGILKSAGIDPTALGIPDTASRAQVVEAIIKPLVLELRNPSGGEGMPGNFSNADRTFLEKAVAGIEKTPGANAGIIFMQKQLAQRAIDMEQLAIKHMEENNGSIQPGFLRESQKYANDNPIFNDSVKAEFNRLVNTTSTGILSSQDETAPDAASISSMSLKDLGDSVKKFPALLTDPATSSIIRQKLKMD